VSVGPARQALHHIPIQSALDLVDSPQFCRRTAYQSPQLRLSVGDLCYLLGYLMDTAAIVHSSVDDPKVPFCASVTNIAASGYALFKIVHQGPLSVTPQSTPVEYFDIPIGC